MMYGQGSFLGRQPSRRHHYTKKHGEPFLHSLTKILPETIWIRTRTTATLASCTYHCTTIPSYHQMSLVTNLRYVLIFLHSTYQAFNSFLNQENKPDYYQLPRLVLLSKVPAEAEMLQEQALERRFAWLESAAAIRVCLSLYFAVGYNVGTLQKWAHRPI